VLALKAGQKEAFDEALRPDLEVEGVDRQALLAMEDEHAANRLG
jgi:hypothetical protein